MGERRRSMMTGVAVLAIVAVGGCSDDTTSDPAGPSTTTAQVVEVSDLAPRHGAALAWTGREVLVFGGSADPELDVDLADGGALVAPDLAAARPLPGAPFDGALLGPAAVVVGDEAVVVGQECREQSSSEATTTCEPGTLAAAVLDLDALTWRSLEIPTELAYDQTPQGGPPGVPARSRAIGSTADGRAVFAIGPLADRYWVVDPGAPADEAWSRIPDPPVAPTDPQLLDAGFSTAVIDECLGGDHLVAIEAVTPVDPRTVPAADDGVRTHVLELTEGATWVEAGVLAEQLDQPFLTCTDEGALLTGGWSVVEDARADQTPRVWMFDLATGAWRPMAAPPTPPRSSLNSRVWTGSEIVFVPSDGSEAGLAYSPSDDTWRTTAASGAGTFQGQAIAAGDVVVGVASSGTGDVPAGALFSFAP